MNAVIRCDASVAIGAGHVMRMLAFAQLLAEKGVSVLFVSLIMDQALLERVNQHGFSVVFLKEASQRGSLDDARQTTHLAREQKAQWVVCDGYAFDHAYQQALRQAGFHVMFIDDMFQNPVQADIVLNQNFGADRSRFSGPHPTKYFLGPKYALVRPEFRAAIHTQRIFTSKVRRIMVTMGGADPHQTSLKVLQALEMVGQKDLEVDLVLGAMFEHKKPLDDYLKTSSLKVNRFIDVREGMADLMLRSDMAITAGGSILWEYAHVSMPVMAVILADNQAAIVENLDKIHAIKNLGWFHHNRADVWAEAIKIFIGDSHMRQRSGEQLHDLVKNHKINEVIDVMSGAV